MQYRNWQGILNSREDEGKNDNKLLKFTILTTSFFSTLK